MRLIEAHSCGASESTVWIRVRDGFRGKEDALDCLRRGNVGLAIVFSHDDDHRDARQRRLGIWEYMARRQHILIRRLDDGHIERLAAHDLTMRGSAGADGCF